jgi:glycosyltransferase involved in cell wall biosynthesis
MSAQLISVIVPSHNHRAFIGSAIESIFNQTYPAVETIVIDDGSADGTPEWLRQTYGERIAHFVAHENRGAHAAINEGIGIARGDYIAILNSDDVFAPTRLSTFLEAMQANAWDLAFSNLTFIDAHGRALQNSKASAAYSRAMERMSNYSIEEALVRENFSITTSNFVVKRDTFNRIGFFRGFRYSHDWDFLLRCVGRCSIGWIREPLLHYRLHPNNTIQEGQHWKLSTENALVYVSFLLEGGSERVPVAGDFVLESESFEPLVVTWLMVEARRVGLKELMRELEEGKLPGRVAAVFNERQIPSGLSTRRILKRVRRSPLAAIFGR